MAMQVYPPVMVEFVGLVTYYFTIRGVYLSFFIGLCPNAILSSAISWGKRYFEVPLSPCPT